MRGGIEKTNCVAEAFSKPDIPVVIEGQILRSRASRDAAFPLIPDPRPGWGQLTDRIGGRLGEPDVAMSIERQEGRAGVTGRLGEIRVGVGVGQRVLANDTLKCAAADLCIH